MHLIVFLIIGGIAGWLAGLLIRGRGFGIIGDIVVGVVGAFIGGFLLTAVGLAALFGAGIIGSIIVAVIGAVVLLFIIKLIKLLGIFLIHRLRTRVICNTILRIVLIHITIYTSCQTQPFSRGNH